LPAALAGKATGLARACASAAARADRVELPPAAARAFGVSATVLLIGLGAQAKFPLPGTPVPVTLQTLFVLLAGVFLGPLDAAAAALAYLALGLAGAPLFALGAGGPAAGWGLGYLAGPTGGYLAGFVAAAGLVGALAEVQSSRARLVLALLLGEGVILCSGWMHLAFVVGAGPERAFAAGVAPFLPGDCLKLAAAFAVVASVRSLRGVRSRRASAPRDRGPPAAQARPSRAAGTARVGPEPRRIPWSD
jgi:biotin transport system substrate-specific component